MTFKSFCNKSYTFVILIFMFLFSLLVIKDIKFKQSESDSNQKYEENWNVFLANMKSKGELFDTLSFLMSYWSSFKNILLSNAELAEVNEFINMDVSKLLNSDAKTKFFQLLALPLQSICRYVWIVKCPLLDNMKWFRVLKRVGGTWHSGGMAGTWTLHKQVDGDKFVCMDQILAGDQCVIYSFGLAWDWTFEDQMDLLGMI